MERIGITIGLENNPIQEVLELCAAAERAGYSDAWSAEVGGADGFSPLAALAMRSSSLRLGTAIVPAFTRPPALLAMSAATLQNLSGGRFVLGVGTSSRIIVERWMGGRFERPLTRLRDYLQILRAALDGEKVSYDGATTRVKDFRLTLDPGAPVPIYLAALGPAACRLAGEIADGVIFFLKTPEGVRRALGWVAEGARAAGRDPGELDCVIRLPVALDEDPEALEVLLRRTLVTYAIVDVYNRSLAAQGFADESRSIATAWGAGDRAGALQAVTREMLEQLFVFGSEEEVRRKLKNFRAVGVRTPVLLPTSVAPDPAGNIARVVHALAPG